MMHAASRPPPKVLDANQWRMLEQQGLTTGLIHAVSYYLNTIPLRVWVIDNSVNMQVRDGHRIGGSTFQNLTTTDCSRWDEAQDEVAFNSYIAGCLGMPTRFNMVNPQPPVPACFSVAEQGPGAVQHELQLAKQIMGQTVPAGPAANFTHHIRQIRGMLMQMAPQLSREGKAVSVLLATSGFPTDAQGQQGPAVLNEFLHALRSLEGFPVWIVVRLCTDDEKVVEFYNTLDAQLSNTTLSYDVLDDFFGEALEIYLKNPWLNYSLPMHRFREFGFNIPVFDELDERTLSFMDLHRFCSILFHAQPPHQQPLPDPSVNWAMFLRALHQVVTREKQHFNPITKTVRPWIDLCVLHRIYGGNATFPQDIPVTISMQNPRFQQQFSGGHTQPQQNGPSAFHQHAQQIPHHHCQAPSSQQQTTTSGTTPTSPKSGNTLFANKYAQQGSGDDRQTHIKHGVITWATAPPSHQHLRFIGELLGTIPQTFPPAFGISDHAYFSKWKPFSTDALQRRDEAVLKRAMRKTKFFFHPDKLPNNLSKEQAFLCKMLWDILADSWEAFESTQ